MKFLAALQLLALLAACRAPAPTKLPSPSHPLLVCLEVPSPTCDAVANAAEALTGTDALWVEELTLPVDEGMEVEERYLVSLAVESGDGRQRVEVVRFAGSDNWSVRRLDEPIET